MSSKAKIIGIGSFLPKRILTNSDLEKKVNTSDEWITTRTGIKERRIAEEGEYTSGMGTCAAINALKEAKISVEEIDLILVATLTPDFIFPSTACIIQKEIGAKNAAAVDIQAACSGFIYGLSFAKAYIETGIYKNILLIASEKLSSIVDYEDRSTCVLFGDGACAAVISAEGEGFVIDGVSLGADGEAYELLMLPAGGSRCPASEKSVSEKKHYIRMEGNEVFKHAVRRMQMAAEKCLEIAGVKPEEICWLIPHQANLRIIEAMAKRFKHIPEERVFKEVVRKYGNTSASSIGIALDEVKGSINSKEKVLLSAFGAGFTWGAAIITRE